MEIDPTQDSARQAVIYLPDKIKEQNEKLKEEMLGKFGGRVSSFKSVNCLYTVDPYIADTIGELHVGRYRGLAVAEGFYKYYVNEIRT